MGSGWARSGGLLRCSGAVSGQAGGLGSCFVKVISSRAQNTRTGRKHGGSTHAQGTHGGQGGNPMDTHTHRRSRERATLTAQEGMVSHVLSNIFHINRLKKHGKKGGRKWWLGYFRGGAGGRLSLSSKVKCLFGTYGFKRSPFASIDSSYINGSRQVHRR